MGVYINEDRDRSIYEANKPKLVNHLLNYAPTSLAEVSRLAGVPMKTMELANDHQVYVQANADHLPVNYEGSGYYNEVLRYYGSYRPKLRGVVVAVRAYLPTETLASIAHEKVGV